MSDTRNRALAHLARAGIDADTAEAVWEIDTILLYWRRRVMKREMSQRALSALGIQMELPQLDVLMALTAPGDDDEDEVMVSTVAQRLGVDPSRASRLTADLIRSGHARRAVSQIDARRSIIEVSSKGRAVVEAVRSFRYILLGEYLQGWSAEDLNRFVPLLARFSSWTDTLDHDRSAALQRDIDALRASVREALDTPDA
ncbi:MarR family transcriptional regulator [Mesobaculum littorinae]|uniref:MarR family transcriptional regulator n=1 Tax=Mesobaculum littorinae TaxID=2486419 RepID=A0A438AE85_9RHOB|nr:MarR family winged helix-turn-helix transcriptional regulator [Mesobaculum littorinae]RVV97023.1 MarR family transcriptional regulator [Mesobaculum littorinae]